MGFSRRAVAILTIVSATGCSAYFPTADISGTVNNRDAAAITKGAASYTVYGGYGSPCAHPGAHFNVNVGSTVPVYAAMDGMVTQVNPCTYSGPNDRYTITMSVGIRGNVPVYLEYMMEPVGGKVCTAAGQSPDFFRQQIFVTPGTTLKKGDHIADFTALGAGAHIHLDLVADGATMCPELFSAAMLADPQYFGGKLSTTSCGGEAIPAGTLCHDLTDSEDPAKVLGG